MDIYINVCVCLLSWKSSIDLPCIFHTHSLSEYTVSAIFGRRCSAWDNKPPPPPRFSWMRERERRRMNFQQNDMIPLLLVNKLNKHRKHSIACSPCPSKTKVSLMAQLHFSCYVFSSRLRLFWRHHWTENLAANLLFSLKLPNFLQYFKYKRALKCLFTHIILIRLKLTLLL